MNEFNVKEKYAIKYFVVNKIGMRFSHNSGFCNLTEVSKVKEKCEKNWPHMKPYTIYKEISTLQSIDSIWNVISKKHDILTHTLKKYV